MISSETKNAIGWSVSAIGIELAKGGVATNCIMWQRVYTCEKCTDKMSPSLILSVLSEFKKCKCVVIKTE